MKQLTGIDAAFLYMETGSQFGHVSGLAIFARPDDDRWSPYEALRAKLTRRLPDLEPMRRKLVEVPLRLDHPFWIEDPDFDLEFHIRESALPAPGSFEQLSTLVSRLIARPLDRGHPLWEVYVIEGLADDRFAILAKLHHATIDGAAGAELIKILYDDAPDALDEPDHAQLPRPDRVPTPAQALSWAFAGLVRKPDKFIRLQVRAIRALGELTRNEGLMGLANLARMIPNPLGARVAARESTGAELSPPPPETAAPATPFNGKITPHRRVALRSISVTEVKDIKNAAGVTVNDVVMAACAGALRRYLLSKGALPASPLVSMVPVSLRTGTEADPWTNRVSAVFPVLPTTSADPAERLHQMQKTMNGVKQRFSLVPADVLVDYANFAPPALAIRAARLVSSLRLADRISPPFNLVISNVPGPRHTLYLGPAEMLHYFPVSTITDTQGLNITVQSYRDTMDFGLVACRELMPDVETLADMLVEEFGELAKAVTGPTSPAPPNKERASRA